jgi:hypothetical protein
MLMLTLACGGQRDTAAERDEEPSLADTQASDVAVGTQSGEATITGTAFLDAFQAPDDTLRISGPAELRLWDAVQVAELPDDDPLRRLDVANTPWQQVAGEPVSIRDAASLDATLLVPQVDAPRLVELLAVVRNASGERPLRVTVLLLPPKP